MFLQYGFQSTPNEVHWDRPYVPQHVWNNEETNVASTDVDLVEVGNTAVAGSNDDILQLNVHVVLSYQNVSIVFPVDQRE